MRLLIVWPDYACACSMRDLMEWDGWQADICCDGREVSRLAEGYDVLLLHLCLPGLDGMSAGNALAAAAPVCPPRILFAVPAEWCTHRPFWADCTVDAGSTPEKLCRLIRILADKPLPKLAAAYQKPLAQLIERFLDELSFRPRLKGRVYAAWLLERLVPSSASETLSLQKLYSDCACFFRTTPAAVERCLRTAVENVFTQGNLSGIEHFFGATIDPERGKPTNRAFLLQAAVQLRYSLATARSLNSSEMHHSPAAPTSV